MKISKLIRVECYRFMHSMDLIKYMLFVTPMIFLIGYFSSRSYVEVAGKENWAREIWGASLSNLFSVVVLSLVITATYVGREFRQKTINYELMQGYSILAIALSKMTTCGGLAALYFLCCMIAVNGIVPGALATAGVYRILLFFLFYFHLFAVSSLFVMIFRNGLTGGIAIFFRFLFLDGIISQIAEKAGKQIDDVIFMTRWGKLLDVSKPISVSSGLWMIIMTLLEILILFGALIISKREADY